MSFPLSLVGLGCAGEGAFGLALPSPHHLPWLKPCSHHSRFSSIHTCSSCQQFPQGQVAGRWAMPLAFLQTTSVPLHQHCSHSLPCFIKENVVPFIAAKKCSSKLSSTHLFRLIGLLNWLEFLFLSVLYRENLKFILYIFHLCLKLH